MVNKSPFDDSTSASALPDEPPKSSEGPAVLPERPPIEHVPSSTTPTTRIGRLKKLVVGPPKNPTDKEVFHQLSLVAFLAWVGLGADGLSSSAYGPAEAFRALLEQGDHTYLAVFLALATAVTVFIISYTYSRIIEQFPYGGGGYGVATQLLGEKVGVISGCALVVDYVLTIATSIASGADALWSAFGWTEFTIGGQHIDGQQMKLAFEVFSIAFLVVLNLRGVKESIQVLVPIFMVFVITHIIVIVSAVVNHMGETTALAHDVGTQFTAGKQTLGGTALLLLFARAYSLGGGTYTGIEAVSNGMQIMREPRVQTAKRTMVYMSFSLAFTAGGILLCYLLVHARPQIRFERTGQAVEVKNPQKVTGKLLFAHEEHVVRDGREVPMKHYRVKTHDGVIDVAQDEIRPGSMEDDKTMNALLVEEVAGKVSIGGFRVGKWFVFVTLLSEMLLLLIAAQAGFIGGPRTMANMALDSWLPHRFGSLSDRLTTANGVVMMGVAAAVALVWVKGSTSALVIMYSINVFVTFSLSNLGMCKFWVANRKDPMWRRHFPVHLLGLLLCLTILCVTVYEKFLEGGWLTLLVTGIFIAVCYMVRRHYRNVAKTLQDLNRDLAAKQLVPDTMPDPIPIIPNKPTAVVLVSSFSGIGIHTCLNIFKYFPGYFSNIVFASAAIIDSGNFKGARHVSLLQAKTEEMLKKYVAFAHSQGMPATYVYAIGTEPVDAAENLCKEASKQHSKTMFFAGQLIFEDEKWYHRLLHNNTAYAIQKRLQWDGLPMIILPVRVRDRA
ncbi:MAG: APC family permease [Planctomycetota bacterium]